jgi:hypothetical protein
MIFPRGKGFDLAGGLVITVILDDLVALTGTFLGDTHEHRGIRHEFILIQLTRPFCRKGGPEIPEGTCCAINVENIQFIVPGVKCQDEMHEDECSDLCNCEEHDCPCQEKAHVINVSCNQDDDKAKIINILCFDDARRDDDKFDNN